MGISNSLFPIKFVVFPIEGVIEVIIILLMDLYLNSMPTVGRIPKVGYIIKGCHPNKDYMPIVLDSTLPLFKVILFTSYLN